MGEQTDFIVCCYNTPLGHVCPASGPAWLPSPVSAASFLLDPFVSRTFLSFRSQNATFSKKPSWVTLPLVPSLSHSTVSSDHILVPPLKSLSAVSLLFLNLPGAFCLLSLEHQLWEERGPRVSCTLYYVPVAQWVLKPYLSSVSVKGVTQA